MQSAQSKATRKYEEKIGMMSKTYKLKREIVEAFAETCARMGTNQSAQLTLMMTEYIQQNKDA